MICSRVSFLLYWLFRCLFGCIDSRRICVYMACRKRPAADISLYQDLVQHGTKQGITNTLLSLQRHGLIADATFGRSNRKIRGELGDAQQQHAKAMTPYGRIVQRMHCPIPEYPNWEIIHPLALLHYLSGLSAAFGDVMADSVANHRVLHLVLYMDEVNPGNPFRPEKSRTLQCIYWAFTEWPQYILQRVAAWPTFGVIRSTTVAKIPHGMATVMKHVLLTFFPPDGHSLMRGVEVHVQRSRESIIVISSFAGFLADEKAHKEVASLKGASGFKPCLECGNCFGRLPQSTCDARGLPTCRCIDKTAFALNTDATVYDMADRLEHAAVNDPGSLDDLEQSFGIKHEPAGLMFHKGLRERSIYRPVSNMIRDWMHVILNQGVANCQLYELLMVLKKDRVLKYTPAIVQEYISHYRLPHKRGSVSASWLGKSRFKNKTRQLASFAGVMLTLVPLINAFLVDVVAPTPGHGIEQHIRCFHHLTMIIGILTLGPEYAMRHMERLSHEMQAHADLFVWLYPGAVKPKFHAMFMHVISDAIRIGRCLSCFVTERKHRITKKCALNVFRHLEATVTRDLVNRHCQTVMDPLSSLFLRTTMVSPQNISLDGNDLIFARQLTAHCGGLKLGDVLFLHDGRVGKATHFWSEHVHGDIYIQLDVYTRCTALLWSTLAPTVSFDSVDSVVDAVAFADFGGGQIRVIIPTLALLV
jgi:hypothetical protein